MTEEELDLISDHAPGPYEPAPLQPLSEVAQELMKCALSWVPDTKLVGNVRANDIARLCNEFLKLNNKD
jgi:hypothetical protein